ncbi:MAG: DUF1570 domain-containing protein [Phycisphaerae bacterium]|nr:DUF1570 domain-containing protein [Phycisphaerae bacterium]
MSISRLGRHHPRRAASPAAVALVVLVGVLVCGCQGKGSARRFGATSSKPAEFAHEDWSYGGAKGSKLTSQHYVLYTTCTAKPFVDAMPGFLESCWEAYASLVPSEMVPDRRLEVYLFQARWQWERFTEQFNPARAPVYKRIRSGGYSERGITVSHYASQRSALSVLAHEGLHQYLELTRGSNIPPWLNEGLATYHEGFDLDLQTNRPVFKPETNYLRTRSLREALVTDQLIPLEEILEVHAGQAVRRGGSHVRSYYAQVWSLTLFLIRPDEDNLYRDGFTQLLQEVGTDSMDRRARAFLATDTDGKMSYGEAVFRAYVTDDLDRFQREYEAYLHKLLRLES